MELELGKRDLEVLLEDSEERIKAIEQASSASVPYPELLAYAQRLSAFTAAPPNLPDDNSNLYGQEPQPLFFPPFPNEEKMRRGRLNAEAPLALLGEVHSVGKAQTTTPGLPDSQLPGHGINPYRRETRPTAPQATFDFDLDLNPDF
ncbi:hypothetical protein PLEOSDRAFT_1042360 [Pleurotus ostreatus PC15]|nr:hypothetical protein PLEOSDRAFT_1042360 [Pleurotus ostreatus PC15]